MTSGENLDRHRRETMEESANVPGPEKRTFHGADRCGTELTAKKYNFLSKHFIAISYRIY